MATWHTTQNNTLITSRHHREFTLCLESAPAASTGSPFHITLSRFTLVGPKVWVYDLHSVYYRLFPGSTQELWPPCPNTNYRKGHYIIGEHVNKIVNKHVPNHPWHCAIIEAVISGLASPDSEATPNTLVVVGHSINRDLARLEEMKIKLPHNVLILDTTSYERQLHAAGLRGVIEDPLTGKTRMYGTTLSLEYMLLSLISHHPTSCISHKRSPCSFTSDDHPTNHRAVRAAGVFGPSGDETPKVVTKGRLQRPFPSINGHGYGFGHFGHTHGGKLFPAAV